MTNSLGLTVRVTPTCTVYKGSKESLINEGICTADKFPEGRKRIKDNFTSNSHYYDHWCMSKLKGNLYSFTVYHERKELTPERGSEYKSLVAWQTKQNDFIKTLTRMVYLTITGESEKLNYGETTIRFDKKTQDRVRTALNEIESAVSDGAAVWANKKLPAAKQDKTFQTFIDRLTL